MWQKSFEYFEWKKWFAWYPVRKIDGYWTWLRKVERRRVVVPLAFYCGVEEWRTFYRDAGSSMDVHLYKREEQDVAQR